MFFLYEATPGNTMTYDRRCYRSTTPKLLFFSLNGFTVDVPGCRKFWQEALCIPNDKSM
jgi:hypothetical protein